MGMKHAIERNSWALRCTSRSTSPAWNRRQDPDQRVHLPRRASVITAVLSYVLVETTASGAWTPKTSTAK